MTRFDDKSFIRNKEYKRRETSERNSSNSRNSDGFGCYHSAAEAERVPETDVR